MSVKMIRVLVEEETGRVTYSTQYTAKTKEDLDSYYRYDAEKLRSEGMKRFADKMGLFEQN